MLNIAPKWPAQHSKYSSKHLLCWMSVYLFASASVLIKIRSSGTIFCFTASTRATLGIPDFLVTLLWTEKLNPHSIDTVTNKATIQLTAMHLLLSSIFMQMHIHWALLYRWNLVQSLSFFRQSHLHRVCSSTSTNSLFNNFILPPWYCDL